MTHVSLLSNQTRRWLVPIVLGAITLVLDQASKAWIVRTLGPEPLSGAIPLAGDWARLIYTRNTGVAFSLFRNAPQLFTPLALLICAGAVYMYVTQLPNRHPLIQTSLGLVLGGAIGNVVDRVRLGYVVDFVQVGWWPVFNLADSAICVGVALLMLALVLTERRHLEAQRA